MFFDTATPLPSKTALKTAYFRFFGQKYRHFALLAAQERVKTGKYDMELL